MKQLDDGPVSAPNACLYLGGPIASDVMKTNPDPSTRADRPQHVRARFRNTQVAFVLADIDRAPPAASTLHFDVHGGFRQEAVVNLTTVQVSAPARLVLGPVDSTRIDMVTDEGGAVLLRRGSAAAGHGAGGRSDARPDRAREPLRPRRQRLPAGLRGLHASNGLFPIQ